MIISGQYNSNTQIWKNQYHFCKARFLRVRKRIARRKIHLHGRKNDCMDSKQPLHEQLKAMKVAAHMTLHQVSEGSDGVPESTISRILSGETDRPSFDVVARIVKAMHGSLDVIAGIEKPSHAAEDAKLRERLEHAEKVAALAQERAQYMKKWLVALFSAFCVLVVVIVVVLILDKLNGDWGYFRH